MNVHENTMNGSPAIPEARRCAACGENLLGRIAQMVGGKYSCQSAYCLSRVFIENIEKIEPSESTRVQARITALRINEARLRDGRSYRRTYVPREH